MYRIRLFAVRRARFFERLYRVVNPVVLGFLRGVDKVFGTRLDGPITAAEAGLKRFLFDCRMCGNCTLSKTGMSCPMNCPKTIRNGPCGGVRGNGMCEVNPDMKCVWVLAWDGASRMRGGNAIHHIEFAIDHRDQGKSTWLRIARGEIAEKVSDRS